MSKIIAVGISKINQNKVSQILDTDLVVKRCPDCGGGSSTPDGRCSVCMRSMRNFCTKCHKWLNSEKCDSCPQDGIQSVERNPMQMTYH